MKMKWYVWHSLMIMALTFLDFQDHGAADFRAFLYAIPINLVLYFLSVWLILHIVRLVGLIRSCSRRRTETTAYDVIESTATTPLS